VLVAVAVHAFWGVAPLKHSMPFGLLGGNLVPLKSQIAQTKPLIEQALLLKLAQTWLHTPQWLGSSGEVSHPKGSPQLSQVLPFGIVGSNGAHESAIHVLLAQWAPVVWTK
jgi:hypothetical protein